MSRPAARIISTRRRTVGPLAMGAAVFAEPAEDLVSALSAQTAAPLAERDAATLRTKLGSEVVP